MNWREEALVFGCGREELVGILTIPERPGPHGVLIVVGGPQYRAGSHRQFALLARDLAQSGVASMRFDYRGMGDSSGAARNFESTEEDIRTAVDRLVEHVPALSGVVIWGLCDAASAALFYAHGDRRISGLVLLNPWVRTEESMARARMQHYYPERLLQRGFWQKVARGELDVLEAARGLAASLVQVFRGSAHAAAQTLADRMQEGLRRFRGRVLVILSGNDLTAQEFKDLVERSPSWQHLLEDRRVTRCDLTEANHTFSRREWRDRVASWTTAWLMQLRD